MTTSRLPSPSTHDARFSTWRASKILDLEVFQSADLPKTMAAKLAITDVLTLSNSAVKIPQLGFGVYLSPAEKCKASCLTALKASYRHIDSAQ
jgi:hypothetical protein